jgi:tetratricopeptide (TPR) repeat protein
MSGLRGMQWRLWRHLGCHLRRQLRRTQQRALLLAALAVGTGAAAQGTVDGGELAAARAATDRRDFTTALPLFERLMQAAPANADLLIEAARVYGWADRNARSAALYRQALAAAPARRADIVPSLAWQTLWAGDAAAALPLFEEAAALRPGDRALGWALANALNHAGRHRAAIAAFGRWQPPATETERLDVARALRWAGFEDRAWPLVQDARSADVAWQRDHRFARDVAPYGFGSFETAEDRDGLRSQALQLGAGLRPPGPLAPLAGAAIELGARRVALDDPFGAPRATSFEASGRLRLGEPDSPAGTWWPQLVLRTHRVDNPTGPWQPFTSAVRLKWVPADRWRVDAERTRELIETPRAFANRVTVDVTSLGADWRRDERLAFAGAAARLRFDDGTTRERFVGRAQWTLATRPRWVLGGESSGFRRTREGAPGSDNRGYWNPRRYDEARVFSTATWDWQPWELQARLGLARSREVDAAGNSSRGSPHLWELALAVDTAPSWRLRAAAGGSGQGLGLAGSGASGARYWRRWALRGVPAWF